MEIGTSYNRKTRRKIEKIKRTKNAQVEIRKMANEMRAAQAQKNGTIEDGFNLQSREADNNLISEQLLTEYFDKCFLTSFINDEMSKDFWEMVRNHVDELHTITTKNLNIPTNDILFLNVKNMNRSFQASFLTIIYYNAVKLKNQEAVDFLKLLYKKYYSAEYMQLKRYQKMTSKAFCCDFFNETQQRTIANYVRVYGMCMLLNININEQEYNRVLNSLCPGGDEFIPKEFSEKELKAGQAKAEVWLNAEETSENEHDENVHRFMMEYFRYHALEEAYVYQRSLLEDVEKPLAETFALLEIMFPGHKFSNRELSEYANLYLLLETFTNYHRQIKQNEAHLLGSIFAGKEIIPVEDYEPVETKPVETLADCEYVEEISNLRRRLKEKDHQCKYFKEINTGQSEEIDDLKLQLQDYENDKAELAALREFVYNLSEEYTEEPVDVEKMKKEIAKRDIVIVGGNENWVSKLESLFPNWRFISPGAADIDKSVILKADKVYFYTATLSHSMFDKIVSILRREKLSFSFIGTVNINKMVTQIYRDMHE